MFCGKSFLRLALVHSKYIGHGIIAKIRTQRRVKFFKVFLQQLSGNVSFLTDFVKSKLL